MKISNLKIGRKALMFLVAGTISVVSPSSTVTMNKGINDAKEKNIDNDEINLSNNIKINEITPIKEVSVEETLPEIKKYKDHTYAYTKKSVTLKETPSNDAQKIKKVDEFQKVKLIEKQDNWNLVKSGNKTGYVKSKNIEKLDKSYIEVDISDQKLKFYNKKGKIILKTDVVTGLKEKRDTILGYYEIYSKQTDRVLRGPGYESHVDYWMPFEGGYGLHDADWRGHFGGNIYTYDGSHGCVNMPDSKAKEVFEKSKIGTKVLIHK